jgi:hypothetical protein
MNGKRAKALRGMTRKPGRAAVTYEYEPVSARFRIPAPGAPRQMHGTARLAKDCDRACYQQAKRVERIGVA